MTMQRFFVEPDDIDQGSGRVCLRQKSQIHQIRKVLRAKVGERAIFLDGRGMSYECVYRELKEEVVVAEIVAAERAGGEPAILATVFLPLLKSGRFEWCLEKLTELGVARIAPIVCARSVVRLDDAGNKMTRWRAIVKESAEQCERAVIPQVFEPKKLEKVLGSWGSDEPRGGYALDMLLVCAERSNEDPIVEYLNKLKASSAIPVHIGLVVGPEGGFAPGEIEKLRASDGKMVSLGSRILRSETAAIFALAQLIAVLG